MYLSRMRRTVPRRLSRRCTEGHRSCAGRNRAEEGRRACTSPYRRAQLRISRFQTASTDLLPGATDVARCTARTRENRGRESIAAERASAKRFRKRRRAKVLASENPVRRNKGCRRPRSQPSCIGGGRRPLLSSRTTDSLVTTDPPAATSFLPVRVGPVSQAPLFMSVRVRRWTLAVEHPSRRHKGRLDSLSSKACLQLRQLQRTSSD